MDLLTNTGLPDRRAGFSVSRIERETGAKAGVQTHKIAPVNANGMQVHSAPGYWRSAPETIARMENRGVFGMAIVNRPAASVPSSSA